VRSSSRFFIAVPLLIVFAALAQQPKSAKKPPAAVSCGPVADQKLKCAEFGFTYKVPGGWVDRTDYMQDDADAGGIPAGHADKQNEAPAKSRTLLAIFSRPPGAPGETINSAVVIVAESLANYHGVKTAANYFGPISELAEQRGFKAVNEPYSFSVGTKPLVRGDFSKDRGKLTMWQSSLVMIEKGYIVSFTFVGGDEDEVEELIARMNFGAHEQHKPDLIR
jgi:hypothetical protein